jgi:hypothetical protein
MTAITYTAKRRLVSGHSSGTSYSLETAARVMDPNDRHAISSNISMDGTTEGVLDRIDEEWSVTTGAIAGADLDAWREFFSSVAAKESFSFDAYGSIASPDNVQSALLEGAPRYRRIGRLSAFTISFKVRVL